MKLAERVEHHRKTAEAKGSLADLIGKGNAVLELIMENQIEMERMKGLVEETAVNVREAVEPAVSALFSKERSAIRQMIRSEFKGIRELFQLNSTQSPTLTQTQPETKAGQFLPRSYSDTRQVNWQKLKGRSVREIRDMVYSKRYEQISYGCFVYLYRRRNNKRNQGFSTIYRVKARMKDTKFWKSGEFCPALKRGRKTKLPDSSEKRIVDWFTKMRSKSIGFAAVMLLEKAQLMFPDAGLTSGIVSSILFPPLCFYKQDG